MQIMKVTHEVIGIREFDGGARVAFADGHEAVFDGYYHGFGYQLEGLRQFRLYHKTALVFGYNARLYRSGPQEDEHKITYMADDFTQDRVAEYWQSARAHAHNEYWHNGKNNWYSWRVTSEGWIDLERLQNGRAEYLTDNTQ